MNLHKIRFLCLVSILFLTILDISAAPAWNLIGLSDRTINCILADDTTMVLAGTNKGMSVHWNNIWYEIPITIPVYSLVRLSADLIAVGVGNGSKSDAIYLGKKVSKGPPFFELTLQSYFVSPTAMTLRNDMAIPRLYVGSGKQGISVFTLGNDTLVFERAFKIPAYAFGVESPRCADLAWFGNTQLFAGGFDQSPNPGTGNLLTLVTDSLQTTRRLNVTSLAQGSFFDVAPVMELVIGTIDTGVFLHNPVGNNWVSLSRPDDGPVSDLLVVTPQIGRSDIIMATTSGVYTNNNLSPNGWTALGKIPTAPVCLAGKRSMTGVLTGELFAGTAEGIYFYSQTTGTNNKQSPAKKIVNVNRQVIRNGSFLLPTWNKGREVEITIYSASGLLVKKERSSKKGISLNIPSGMFYYKCTSNGNSISSGVLMNF